MNGFVRRSLAVVLAPALLAACGGGEPSGPPPVATVAVSAFSQLLTVGQTTQLSVTLTDSKGKTVTTATLSYASSAPDIASVTQAGSVSAIAPGTATITATAQGKTGSVAITVKPVPVAGILISPRTTTLRIGETVTLSATPVDISLVALPGRAVTWSSADPTRASVTSAGLVTAVSSGTVYIRAESEGVSDSAIVRVRSLSAPSITAASPAMLAPGAQGTITGANFSANPADVAVLVNGAPAAVTAATAASVTFTVPSATALPCSATGPVPLAVVVNGDTATFNHPLSMATPRTLAVGQSMLLTDPTSLACAELPQNGAHYVFTVFNYGTSTAAQLSFRVDGNAGTPTGPAVGSRAPALSRQAAPSGPTRTVSASELALLKQRETAHARVMTLNEQVLRAHPHPLNAIRAARASRARLSTAAAPLPAVGDMADLRIVHSFSGTLDQFDVVRARAVYVGSKIIIYEDSLAPLARTMDTEYQSIGKEFDDITFPVLSNFGDPLALDAQTDNNGRIVALFSKRVNGLSSGLLGFVGSWDFFPQTGADGYAASNVGEYFYAYVPDPSTTGYARDVDTWKRYIRGTLAHESKHITSFAERIAIDASRLEDRWLEESTAQLSSEMWARALYNKTWKSDAGWLDGPRCDYATSSATCPDPVIGLMHHFGWLYDYDVSNERLTVLSNFSNDGSSLYGSAWLFARYLTDQYAGGDEASFLRALVVQPNDAGVTNVVNRTGKPFSETFGFFTLATVVDDYPGFTPSDVRLTIPSWNTRDVFAGMNAHLVTGGGQPAFPRAFPLNVRTLTYGSFAPQNAFVGGIVGGGYIAFDLAGPQTGPQSIGIRSALGGLAPSNIGMAIVRVQ
jgi:hypothetical protein